MRSRDEGLGTRLACVGMSLCRHVWACVGMCRHDLCGHVWACHCVGMSLCGHVWAVSVNGMYKTPE